jgi:trimethylamine corrinoid protein
LAAWIFIFYTKAATIQKEEVKLVPEKEIQGKEVKKMSEKEMFERLKKSVIEMDEEGAKAAANDAIAQKLDPLACIEGGLSAGMKVISDKFDDGDIYVPQIILSAEAFTAAVETLSPHVEGGYSAKGKIILHTVEGDIHDIGKNIVGILLQANGFEVIDLGRDVAIGDVVDAAVEKDVDIIAGSALMTTTMPAQREIVIELKERGIKDKFKCLFGGAPTSQEWTDKIGADGWAENAAEAVDVVNELTS